MNMISLLTSRRALGLVFVLAAMAMGAGYYAQHVIGLEPCPLCIVQRLAFVTAGALGLLGAVFGARAGVALVFGALTDLAALAGGGVAAWHTWLIAHPPEWAQCGRPFAWMLENNTLVTLIPKLFKGEGDCLTVGWTLLGLNIPQWAVLIFLGMMVLANLAIVGAARALRSAR